MRITVQYATEEDEEGGVDAFHVLGDPPQSNTACPVNRSIWPEISLIPMGWMNSDAGDIWGTTLTAMHMKRKPPYHAMGIVFLGLCPYFHIRVDKVRDMYVFEGILRRRDDLSIQ